MTIKHEFWKLIASGHLTQLVAQLQALGQNVRESLIRERSHTGWVRMQVAINTTVAPERGTVEGFDSYIEDIIYNPTIANPIPAVANYSVTAGTGVFICDDPGTDPESGLVYETVLFSWNFVEFIEVGVLADQGGGQAGITQAVDGNYVLVNRVTETENYGLPTPEFLTVDVP